jgi:deoxyribodipyrimidine photo-lyase
MAVALHLAFAEDVRGKTALAEFLIARNLPGMIPTPTRAAALARLETFVPHSVRYAGRRNFDLGAGKHDGVSGLSPYIRTRLVTEEECTRAVLASHSPRAAEKFLQEIAWRTYWKGWLEMRPGVWDDYLSALAASEKTSGYGRAIAGRSGIECFDHWANELLETGYLHNHARMWFASIWIFTLKLPWQLGADFFLHHLLDADPAANTLSWRWVAGLHTPGKHYLARAENITKYTLGRFDPAGQLDEKAVPIAMDHFPEGQPLHLPPDPKPQGRTGHLMFPEDLAAPPAELGEIHATAAYLPAAQRTSPLVTEFLQGAINSALTERRGTLLGEPFQSSLTDWISAEKLDSIVISRPTVGHSRDFLLSQRLPPRTHTFIRSWDRLLWPHATAGFFKLKAALPKIHAALAPMRKDDLFPHV